MLAITDTWGLDPIEDERFNPNGSGIPLGHPVGATGARILATMLRELDRRKGRYTSRRCASVAVRASLRSSSV